jgi:hypothetical protein
VACPALGEEEGAQWGVGCDDKVHPHVYLVPVLA